MEPKLIEIRGQIGDLKIELDYMNNLKGSAGEIIQVYGPKDEVGRDWVIFGDAFWLVTVRSESDNGPLGERKATIHAVTISPTRVKVRITDAFVFDDMWWAGQRTILEPIGESLEIFTKELERRLAVTGRLKPLQVAANEALEQTGDPLQTAASDSLSIGTQSNIPKKTADEMIDELIQVIKTKGLGHRPETDNERAAAWLAWRTTPKAERPKLETWLTEKFGVEGHDMLIVQPGTFQSYKKKVPKHRRSDL